MSNQSWYSPETSVWDSVRGRKPKKEEEESKNLTEELKEEVTENKENEIQETETLNEDNGYIDNEDEVVMAQDGFFEELEKE